MPWIKFDDEYFTNPKVKDADRDTWSFHVSAIIYCRRNRSGGLLRESDYIEVANQAKMNVKKRRLYVEKCVAAGLFDLVEGGVAIHDYSRYNPLEHEGQSLTQVRSEAGTKGGLRSGEVRRERTQDTGGSQNGDQVGIQVGARTGTNVEPERGPTWNQDWLAGAEKSKQTDDFASKQTGSPVPVPIPTTETMSTEWESRAVLRAIDCPITESTLGTIMALVDAHPSLDVAAISEEKSGRLKKYRGDPASRADTFARWVREDVAKKAALPTRGNVLSFPAMAVPPWDVVRERIQAKSHPQWFRTFEELVEDVDMDGQTETLVLHLIRPYHPNDDIAVGDRVRSALTHLTGKTWTVTFTGKRQVAS